MERQSIMKKAIGLRQATPQDTDTVTDLALLLWPGHGREALRREMEAFCTREDAAAFLASADGVPVGFAVCALRREYVAGAKQSPAGYLEGIFVAAAFRRRGAAAGLLRCCEAWAKEKGCAEFASDCELGNEESRLFHAACGFSEACRTINFVKRLAQAEV